MVDPKVLQQEYNEQVSVELGIKKYRDALATTPLSEMGAGLSLMKDCIEPMIEALNVYFLPSKKGNANMHKTKETLKLYSPEVLAFITAKRVINSLNAPAEPLQKTCISLADMLKDNLEYEKFKAEHPGYLYRVEQNLKTSTLTHKRRVITRAKNKLGVTAPEWSEVNKYHIGRTLIYLLIDKTGVVKAEKIKYKNKDTYVLIPTEETVARLEKDHKKCELLHPVYYPMVIPPRPWTVPFDGGFIATEPIMRQKLVKTRDTEELLALADHDMPEVYAALNAMQNTAWRINRRVMDVYEALWNEGTQIAGLPGRFAEPLPAKPWGSGAPTPEELKLWKRKATEVYDRNVRQRSKRIMAATKLHIADRFKDEPSLYFCYTMDWRGRVYPTQNYINPQMDDSGRALIEFAEGKPLGEHGAKWLAVHGANCFGIDKVSFDDRVAWVEENSGMILRSAANPLDFRWWTEAENPFQFLAFCFEWDAYKTLPYFESHLPVGMDGSCNGLQNFSGMLLDPVGGKATNLIPSDKPADIYQEVADVLNRMVNDDAAQGNPEAIIWQGKVTRKVTKRGVMTTPYGAKKYGLKTQLKVELAKIDENYLGVEDDAPAIKYLAGKLYDAIGEVVVAARDAMDWLQAVARVCSKANKPIRWTTPIGFRPVQNYKVSFLTRVDTVWGGVRLQLGLLTDTDKMDKRKQASGISPNYVHSLDAAHLMLTVNACKEAGINSFAMVHDSYGTHAGDIETLNAVLRETFITMYSEDRLAQFYSEIAAQLPPELIEEIPELPARGTLDLNVVRESRYFFA